MSYDKTIQLLVIGDSSVGKTSLITRYTNGTFKEEYLATVGLDYYSKVEAINNQTINIKLWDTAGQERFRSITTTYYKSSQGLLLMYDITNKDTFDNLDSWFQSINESLGESNNYLVVLLGNKVDLVNNEPDKRQVTAEEAENICKDKNIYWGGECSAKDFTEEQLKEMFTKFTEEMYKKVGTNIVKGSLVKPDPKPKKFKC